MPFFNRRRVRDTTQPETEARSTTPMSAEQIVFEHPLNERARTLLRLEFLFAQGAFGASGDTAWHSRIAVDTLVDLVALLGRGDMRSEIQKELERVVTTLQQLRERSAVDVGRLEPLLEEAQGITQSLRDAPTGMPPAIRDNEFLTGISQRSGVPGGSCGFDIPGYHRWLQRPAAQRQTELQRWFEGFHYLSEATRVILHVLRNSAIPADATAENGTYQAQLDRETPYQLLRVTVPGDSDWYPEISGSRHFCTIRFMRQPDPCVRPEQVAGPVAFQLECCAI